MKRLIMAMLREYAVAKGIMPGGVNGTRHMFDIVRDHMFADKFVRITPKVLKQMEDDIEFQSALNVYCPDREAGGVSFWHKGKQYGF